MAGATPKMEDNSSGKRLSLSDTSPLPRLASITSFRSPLKTLGSPSSHRQLHPKPRKIMATSDKVLVSAALRQQRPPSAVSAIPRPTSGSSRRATPVSVNKTRNSHVSAEATIRPLRHVRRRSGLPITSNPPSSYTVQRARPPRSDSKLPYEQRLESRDLSGVRQQLHLRNYSTQSYTGLDHISSDGGVSSNSLPLPGLKGLPKSKTSVSLTRKVRELSPQRQLMQPLGPPTPKIQTVGGLSCFIGAEKDEIPPLANYTSYDDDAASVESMVGVIDALLESRMTDEEVKILKMVEKEAQDKTRLRSSSGGYHYIAQIEQVRLSSLDMRKSATGAAIKLSASDVANSRRREEQRHKMSSNYEAKRRSLFNNSAVASTRARKPALLTPAITPRVVSGPEDWEVNLKEAYFAECIQYWTGRFVALSDKFKIRDASMTSSHSRSDRSSPSNEDFKESFASAEARRTKTALAELQSYCRTKDALKSFELFEAQLKQNLMGKMETPIFSRRETVSAEALQNRSAASRPKPFPQTCKPKHAWWLGPGSEAVSATSRVSSLVASSGTGTSAKGGVAGSDVQHVIGMERPPLAKSKTTGNLAAYDYCLGRADPPVPTLDLMSGSLSWSELKPIHRRKACRVEAQPWITLKTLREREERAQQRAEQTRRRVSKRDVSAVLLDRNSMDLKGSDGVNEVDRHKKSAIKDDFEMQKTRTRSGRQSSGEILKFFLDSGIKGVKRMGRRVTGGVIGEDIVDI